MASVTLILFLLGATALWITGASNVRDVADDLIAAYFMVWGIYAMLSKGPREEIQKRFVLLTVVLISLFALAEAPGVLGPIDYRKVFSTPGSEMWYNPGYVVDDELLWVHQPHDQVKGRYGRGNIGEMLCFPYDPHEYDLQYDRNGFRNDRDLARADIAVIGDSYVESPMMPSSVLMTSVLGELEKSTVANLGLSGYGPSQELIVLKRYALELQPKTIVWVFFEGNDLKDVHDYEKNLASVPTRLAMRWQRSFTRNLLWSLLHLSQECTPNPYFAERYAIVGDADGRGRRIYLPSDWSALSEEDLDALNKTRSMLTAAYQLCRERGIRLVVVFASDMFRVYDGLPNLVKLSEAAKRWEVNDLPERLRTIVSEISPDIEYLDLTSSFRAEAAKGTPVFLPDDSHWSAEGHRIVAEALHKRKVGSPTYVAKQREGKLKHNVALMVRGPDGTIRYWNEEAKRLYGWDPEEALGKSSHSLLRTIFPRPLRSLEMALLEKGHWEGELVHKRRDGSQVIVASRWELQRNAKDQRITVVEMNSDQVVEPDGGQSNEDVALMVRASDGTIHYWNKGAEHLYGWESQEALGRSSHRVLKTVFPQPLPNIEAELIKTGHWEGKLLHKRRDGSQVIVSSRWELQRNEGLPPTVVEINSEPPGPT